MQIVIECKQLFRDSQPTDKAQMKISPLVFGVWLLGITSAFSFSDTLWLNSGTMVDGTVIQTNSDAFMLLTDSGTFLFSKTAVKQIGTVPPLRPRRNRYYDFRGTVLTLCQQSWCSNLTQIPATVIDTGVFKNVPYLSFRCGEDYEVNIYGDLKDPAAIEVGVYRKLLTDDNAKQNCLKFVNDLMSLTADKEIVKSLDTRKDTKNRDGLAFEITPPDAKDAYEGWWVSVYSEDKLNRSRASEKEMESVTVAKSGATTSSQTNVVGWTTNEMKLSRPYVAIATPPARTPVQVTPVQTQPTYRSYSSSPSTPASSSGGTVYVRSYTRKDGTYVPAHTRSAPRRKN